MILTVLILIMTSCSRDLTFNEVNMNHLNQEMKEFTNAVVGENGTSLL